MPKIKEEYGQSLLIPLFCPKCKRQVAVTDRLPGKGPMHTEKDITLMDGRTPSDVSRLVCKSCFQVFPYIAAKLPHWIYDTATTKAQEA
jgi:hypothetical protein